MPVSGFVIEQLTRGHPYCRIETDSPPDLQIIGGHWDFQRNQMVLTVTSSTFDDMPEGSILMEWVPTITLHMDETAQLLEIVHRGMQQEATDS